MRVQHSWQREKARVLVVPKVFRCRAWGQVGGGASRCKIKMGVLTTRGLVGSAQELALDPEDRGELLAFRKLTGQDEQLSCALQKAPWAVSLASRLEARRPV